MKFRALGLIGLVTLLAMGCGGGGGGSTAPNLGSFSIVWPSRTATPSTPLTSSLSAVVTFPKADGHSGDVSETINRDSSQTGSYTGNYQLPPAVVPGAVSAMVVSFCSNTAGQGTVVGTAAATAPLAGSSPKFPPVVFSALIKHVNALPITIVQNGAPTQLAVSATDSVGNVVAVSQGWTNWAVVSGSGIVSLTPDGVAAPQSVGIAQVTATIDGIVSDPAPISVVLTPVSNATFQIAWPARSRGILNHSLSSAQSVQVTFKGGQVDGSDLSMAMDRPNTLSAYTSSYQITQPIQSTCQSMTATFYSQAAEQGVVVGTAAAQVVVGPVSVSLGSIVVDGTIHSVRIIAPGNIPVGRAPTQLQFSALDAKGSAVAVSAGSGIWSVTSGQANLSVTPDGLASGDKPGTSSVVVTVDGISSLAATIPVVTGPTTTIFGIDASDIAYDSTHNVLYACATADSPVGPSQIVPINMATGAVGTPFSVGASPTRLCVSSDGSELFVANGSGQFFRVPTSTRVVDLTFNIPSGMVAEHLLPLPNAPGSFLADLSPSTAGIGATPECVVYDGGSMRPNTPNLGFLATTDSAGTKVFGIDSYDPNSLYTGSVTSAGIVDVSGPKILGSPAGGSMCYQNGVLAVAGYVDLEFVRASDGSLLASTGDDAWYRYVAPSVGTNEVYLLSWSVLNNNQVILQPYDVSSFAAVGGTYWVSGFAGSPAKMIAAGPHRVVFFTTGSGATDSIVVESSLP